MTKDTGGPAFPTSGIEYQINNVSMAKQGMQLRDYFAAKAMASCPLHQITDKAEWAYRMADAMLEARK